VFAALDPELFKACFLAWVSGLCDADADIIAIDSLPRRRPIGAKNFLRRGIR
jgi:putative N-acetylmannosamine-6-phosphate epimerase